MRFRDVAIILLAVLAILGGGQFRIAKVFIKEPGRERTVFRVFAPGGDSDVVTRKVFDLLTMISCVTFTTAMASESLMEDLVSRRDSVSEQPNLPAPGNGATARFFQIQRLRRAVPEQYR